MEFARLEFRVIGLDVDEKRVAAIERGESYISVVKHAPLIVDTVNATKGLSEGREKILRIGAPAA